MQKIKKNQIKSFNQDVLWKK